MTKDEALRLALEYVELVPDDRYNADHIDRDALITTIKTTLEAKDEPVSVLQKPTSERAWFTITELNAWADKKLSENPHWVMPKDEPERDDPPPQRTWVGLTDEDKASCVQATAKRGSTYELMAAIEAKLKEKNT